MATPLTDPRILHLMMRLAVAVKESERTAILEELAGLVPEVKTRLEMEQQFQFERQVNWPPHRKFMDHAQHDWRFARTHAGAAIRSAWQALRSFAFAVRLWIRGQ